MPILMRMDNLSFRIVMIISLFFVLGCKKPLENPETIDPIYNEFLKMEKDNDALFKLRSSELDIIKKDWESSDTLSGRKKTAKARYFAKLKEVEKAEQQSKYYRLRAKTRKMEARKAYRAAFNSDLPWPPPEEYESFLAENRLKNSSRSWDSRVPRWNQRLQSAAKEAKAEAKSPKGEEAGGGSSGGGH